MIRLCMTKTEPVEVDGPLATGLQNAAATIAIYEGIAQGNLRVLFAAENRAMANLSIEDDEDHAHVVIEDWQALATYNAN